MNKRWINRILATIGMGETRTSLENPQTPLSFPAEWLLDIFNGGRTDSGIRVSEMTALQVGTVYACVNVIANGIASLPLSVVEKVRHAGKTATVVAHDHPAFDVLHSSPNVEMTTHAWLKTFMVHSLLWGNGFTEIQRDGANKIVALWPRNPARTRAIRNTRPVTIEGDTLPAGTLMYETYDATCAGQNPIL